jgi:hypothetical protein
LLAERPGFLDPHRVADSAFILLIVSDKLGRSPDELPVFGMFDLSFDLYDDGLFHLIADDQANTFFS